MAYGSRTPESNRPEAEVSENNPWGTTDDFFHLLNKSAIRCCHCQKVVAKEHITVIDGHVFCPDDKDSVCTTCTQGDHRHSFNVTDFIEHNNL